MPTAADVWTRVRYRPLLREFFAACIRFAMRRHFSQVHLLLPSPIPDQTRPWIFLANHISWWDGFFLWALQRELAPERRIFTVMLAREFIKLRWFRWIGALPLEPESVGSFRFLLRFIEELARKKGPPFILSFFPQGAITPMAARPLRLHRGWQGLVKKAPHAVLLPLGLHIEPGTERRPQVWIALGQALDTSGLTEHQAHSELTHSLERCLDTIAAELSSDAVQKEKLLAHTRLF